MRLKGSRHACIQKSTYTNIFSHRFSKQKILYTLGPLGMVKQVMGISVNRHLARIFKTSTIIVHTGANILSFVFRQLTDDLKKENSEKESVQFRIPISYSPE